MTTEPTFFKKVDSIPENDTAPKKRRGRPPGSKNASSSKAPSFAAIETQLTATVAAIGMAVSMRNEIDGQIIVEGAEAFSKGWVELAKTNPAVKKALVALVAGSTWTGAIMGTAAIAVPIMANHKMLPENVASVILAGRGIAVIEREETADGNNGMGKTPFDMAMEAR